MIETAANAVIPTPTRISTKTGHSVHVALLEIEKVIGSKKHLYMNRLIEGYNVPGDSLYIPGKDYIMTGYTLKSRSRKGASMSTARYRKILSLPLTPC